MSSCSLGVLYISCRSDIGSSFHAKHAFVWRTEDIQMRAPFWEQISTLRLNRPSGQHSDAGEIDDARILRDLFDGMGVMSALDHSKIEGANNPETLNIDAQAARIARKAAEALKRSRQVCQVRMAPSLSQMPNRQPLK